MTDLPRMGMPQYSELGFGESLSKVARHELAILCLEGIRLELSRKPIPNKSRGRGRPTSPLGVLAKLMDVSPDSVRRWTNLREIQASDFNATRLAEMAYAFDRVGVEKILSGDIARHRETMDKWLKEAESNYGVSPYFKNPLNGRAELRTKPNRVGVDSY